MANLPTPRLFRFMTLVICRQSVYAPVLKYLKIFTRSWPVMACATPQSSTYSERSKCQLMSQVLFFTWNIIQILRFWSKQSRDFTFPEIMKSAWKSLQLSFDLTQTLQNGRLLVNDHDAHVGIALLERFTMHLTQLRCSAIQIMIIMNPQRSLPRDFWRVGTTYALISMIFLIGSESLSRFEEHFCGVSEWLSEWVSEWVSEWDIRIFIE